ncbi:hypothetical protein A9K75_06630 [Campylobacter fetus subsp. testudinum]|uniref:conjugal transfer protein TraH n=1 Tax=Campylobacter fetus TaxID=196 RepID=UPI000818B519|nr:conjugal transfer protein TraH [Campylobacter fetus]OCR99541.1 hypothetical protein A9K75_06630 [Campylobacter fetus subsp. testudinum]
MENLKKVFFKFAILVLFVTSANAALDDFLAGTPTGSKFDYGKPSSISTQVRGYYNFGGASVRDYGLAGVIRPFHIEAPSIHSGCSGIDAIFGGFSYLNIQYLVEKLQKIVSAAPAFVFQLALSTLCKDCQQILQELEAIANSINAINFDGCKAAVNWGKNIGNALNNSLFTGDDVLPKLKDSGGDSYLDKAKNAIGDFAKTINATVNCTDGSLFGICNSSSDEKTKAKLEKDYFQGSMLGKFFKEGLISDDFFTKLKDDEDFKNWLGKNITKQATVEELFRSIFGDLYGYVDEETCGGGKDNEGAASNAFRLIVIKPTESSTDIIRNFFFTQESNSTSKVIGITKITEHNADCGGTDKGFKALPEIDQTQKITINPNVDGESLTTYLFKKIQMIAIAVENNDVQTVKNNITFLDSLSYPAYRAVNLYTVSHDSTLLEATVKYIMASKARTMISKMVNMAFNMQNLIAITETTEKINDLDLPTYMESLQKLKQEISAMAQKEEELAKKTMQDRMSQIQAFKNVEQTLKEGMYGLDGSGMSY